MARHTFHKRERLCSRSLIETLFEGGAKSFSAYPLRAVMCALPVHLSCAVHQVLISVSKRRLHHAVDRNRAKRQMREAYRLQKEIIAHRQPLAIAFLWLSDTPVDSARVHRAMRTLLHRINETGD